MLLYAGFNFQTGLMDFTHLWGTYAIRAGLVDGLCLRRKVILHCNFQKDGGYLVLIWPFMLTLMYINSNFSLNYAKIRCVWLFYHCTLCIPFMYTKLLWNKHKQSSTIYYCQPTRDIYRFLSACCILFFKFWTSSLYLQFIIRMFPMLCD